ncbi:MAG: FecR domain-containing protein [Lachnospiraceae bacterium]
MKGLLKSVKGFLKTTKGKAALGVGTAAVVGVVVAVAILLNGQGYRTIAVQEVNGTSIIKNEKQESSNAYVGMHLNSGDDATVQAASDMTLLLDMDKYVYAEENTHFWLQAEGDSETSKTRIYLDQGSILNRLNTKLENGEEYEVDTPNSVMAVRGTVFRSTVYYDSNGIAWTRFEVFQGSVYVELKTLEGEFNGISEVFNAGEAAVIRASSDFSEFVADDNGEVKRSIEYESIPQGTALKLVQSIDEGEELYIGKELLMDYTKLEEHKMEEVIVEEATCSKEGQKEVHCIVCNEVIETITISKLPHEVPDEWENVEEPDCVNTGLEQKVCSVCGEIVETQEINALGHTSGIFVVTAEATCTGEGQRVQRCTVCNEILRRETIAALGHSDGDWSGISAATCTSDGVMGKLCSRCGTILETTSIAALGHSYGGWSEISAATCTSGGSESRTCSRCGDTETSATAATGHSYGAWKTVTEANCTENGKQSRRCSGCGNLETSAIPATGHTYVYTHDWSTFEFDGTTGKVVVTIACSQGDIQVQEAIHTIQFDTEAKKYHCVHCDKDVTEEMGRL